MQIDIYAAVTVDSTVFRLNDLITIINTKIRIDFSNISITEGIFI